MSVLSPTHWDELTDTMTTLIRLVPLRFNPANGFDANKLLELTCAYVHDEKFHHYPVPTTIFRAYDDWNTSPVSAYWQPY